MYINTILRKLFPIVLMICFLGMVYYSFSYPNGIISRNSTTTSGCGTCHGSSSSSLVTVGITSGSGSFTVMANSTTTFTVSVTNGTKVNAGVNVAVKTSQTTSPGTNIGTITAGTNLRTTGTPVELTQSSPVLLSGGTASFSFNWTAPATTGTYYIRAVGLAGNGDGGINNDLWNWMTVQAVTVVAGPSLSVTSPNGAEEICAGKSTIVRWTSSGVSLVKIELSSDGGSTYPTLLADNINASAGTWTWALNSAMATGTTYKIRVTDVNNANVKDQSNNDFTIYAKTSITEQPVSLMICTSNSAVFTCKATGYNVEYQWRKDGVDILNANLQMLTISNSQMADSGKYSCLVTGLCDSVNSLQVDLKLKLSPAITVQPKNDTTCIGGNLIISTEAIGTALNYSWSHNGLTIPGSNAAELTLNNVTMKDSGAYQCVVSGACLPKVTSNYAYIKVYQPVTISVQPVSKAVLAGANLTLSLTAGGTNVKYQWRKKGDTIPGATKNTFDLKNITPADSGNYDCIVSNRCGSLTSKAAKISIIQQEQPNLVLALLSVDFGNLPVGTSKDTILGNVIHNTSSTALTITALDIAGKDPTEFSIQNITLPMTVPGGEYRDMNIRFSSKSEGVKSAVITFTSNSKSAATLNLIGFGTTAVKNLTVTGYDFGLLMAGNPYQGEIRLINGGNVDDTITSITLTGDSVFTLTNPALPFEIKAGETVKIPVTFYPTKAGDFTADLTIEDNDGTKITSNIHGSAIPSDVLEPINSDILKLNPNPATDFIEISVGANGRSPLLSDVKIYDVFGQNVNPTPALPASGEGVRIDVSGLAPGLYFVRIGDRVGKFVKI
jgi:hypothetical protein